MNYRTASFYSEFHCIGGGCEDSCCENWEIDLDDESLKNYMKQKGAIGKRLKKNTNVKSKQFILNGKRCPFLNGHNLCDIYAELGEESLCETCTNFPRHVEEFDNLKEVSLTMSCPEASRIMLSKQEKMSFVTKDGRDSDYGLKCVADSKFAGFWKRKHINKLDRTLFPILYDTRALFFRILQERSVPLKLRAAAVLILSDEIQRDIDKQAYEDIRQANERIQRVMANGQILGMDLSEKVISEYDNREKEKKKWLVQVLNMYQGLETIKDEWVTLLTGGMEYEYKREDADAFDEHLKEREYEFEHILVYYLFNYYLGAAYDADAHTKVKMAVMSYIVIRALDISFWKKYQRNFTFSDQVLVSHAYSKEVEHSYNNYESLQLVLSAHPLLDTEQILVGLLS